MVKRMFRIRRRPRAVYRGRARAVILAAAAVIFGFLIIFWLLLLRAEPTVALIARARAREHIILAVNDAVSAELEAGRLRYGDLVTLERDNSGAVTALITDMAKINLLQSQLTTRVASNVVSLLNTDMAIHLGDIFNSAVFTGRGPRLPVRAQSVTNISTQFKNDFSDAGINQTRHRITLEISLTVDILIPGGRTQAAVTTEVAVAETIIVGGVPNVYTDMNV